MTDTDGAFVCDTLDEIVIDCTTLAEIVIDRDTLDEIVTDGVTEGINIVAAKK